MTRCHQENTNVLAVLFNVKSLAFTLYTWPFSYCFFIIFLSVNFTSSWDFLVFGNIK